jgi:hypothetical protein
LTNIVQSTKRAAELVDREWKGLLNRHHETVRQQLARFRGREVKKSAVKNRHAVEPGGGAAGLK